jgi:hypothetical protein
MKKIIRNKFDEWEVSLISFQDHKGFTKYKVTRRFVNMSVAETKIFDSKKNFANAKIKF